MRKADVEIFTDVLPCPCHSAEDLVTGARLLIHSSVEADGGNVLLAKATYENKALVFMADRDFFEFSLRTLNQRTRIVRGNLASELRGISLDRLAQMMALYLEQGVPIVLPHWKPRKKGMRRT